MKKLITILILAAAALTVGVSKPKVAECQWCPTYSCYNNYSCGSGCACMKFGNNPTGQCVSIGAR